MTSPTARCAAEMRSNNADRDRHGAVGCGQEHRAARALEDIEFTCIDNIPVPLVDQVVDYLAHAGDRDKLAIAIDEGQHKNLGAWGQTIGKLRGAGHRIEVHAPRCERRDCRVPVLRDAAPSPAVGRRPCPKASAATARSRPLTCAMARPSSIPRTSIRTSSLVIPQDRYGGTGKLAVTFVSFGFKHGLPLEFNLVFDVRFLPNPHFEPALAHLDGRDASVASFVLGPGPNGSSEGRELVGQIESLLRFQLPLFQHEGKLYVTVCVGCTGGQHRSVAVVEELRRRLGNEWDILVRHRDVDREEGKAR